MIVGDIWDFFLSDPGQRALQNVIAITALWFAIRGVRNWNLERRDIRRAELAEKALALAYRLKDTIASVRSPFGYGGEGETRKGAPNERPELKQALDSAFVPIERLNNRASDFEELATLAYSINAAFGPNAADDFLTFIRVRGRIVAAAHSKMRDARHDRDLSDADIARMERNDAIIWGNPENDEIETEINAAVAALEARFRPVVEVRFGATRYRHFWITFWKWLNGPD